MSLDRLTFSLQASLASLIRWLVSGEPPKTNATSGLKSNGSSAQLNRDGSWERTYQGYSQATMDGFTAEFSPTWTRWGIVSHGQFTGLARSARPTNEIGSSLWPTILSSEAEHGGPHQRDSGGRPTLTALARKSWPTPRAQSANGAWIHGTGGMDLQTSVHMWPTPTTIDAGSGRINTSESPQASAWPTLALMARKDLWPTPVAQDGKNSTLPPSQQERATLPGARVRLAAWPTPNTGDAKGGASIQTNQVQLCYVAAPQVGQHLNPEWVEVLQGFPEGWTDIGGPLVPARSKRNGSHRARSRAASQTGHGD